MAQKFNFYGAVTKRAFLCYILPALFLLRLKAGLQIIIKDSL